jgi:hypothetical protein
MTNVALAYCVCVRTHWAYKRRLALSSNHQVGFYSFVVSNVLMQGPNRSAYGLTGPSICRFAICYWVIHQLIKEEAAVVIGGNAPAAGMACTTQQS